MDHPLILQAGLRFSQPKGVRNTHKEPKQLPRTAAFTGFEADVRLARGTLPSKSMSLPRYAISPTCYLFSNRHRWLKIRFHASLELAEQLQVRGCAGGFQMWETLDVWHSELSMTPQLPATNKQQ